MTIMNSINLGLEQYTLLNHYPADQRTHSILERWVRDHCPHFPAYILSISYSTTIMFEQKLIAFEHRQGGFDLAGASIIVDIDDYEGVKIAAKSLSNDLERVTGRKSEIIHNTNWSII